MSILLVITTSLHRYAARHEQGIRAQLYTSRVAIASVSDDGKPLVSAELGALLDPADCGLNERFRGLFVPLRRRSALLLCNGIEEFHDGTLVIEPLPALLAMRLGNPWVCGVCNSEQGLLLALDLRALAQHLVTHQG